MSPATMNKVLGAIKDQASIHLTKLRSKNLTDLKVAILKATTHEESPTDDAYTREILSLTRSSPTCITACVRTIIRRLTKTKNWTVAMKTLMLIHRLIVDGGVAYEEEIQFATGDGSQLRNAFNDRFQSGSCHLWAFIRMYALYLDERLHYRKGDPLRKMEISSIFQRTNKLQVLFQRVLECRPTGDAENNVLVTKTLRAVLKESFQLYSEMTEILSTLIERFVVLDMKDCVKIPEMVSKIVKQCEKLEHFYNWSRNGKILTSCDNLRVEKITNKKVEIIDRLVTERYNLGKRDKIDCGENLKEGVEVDANVVNDETNKIREEPDLLDLRDDEGACGCESDKLALALFDAGTEIAPSRTTEETTDWEAALVETASKLSQWKASLGGGLDMLMLDGMYGQSAGVGSASSDVLALPAPTTFSAMEADPFAASLSVPPPTYVQLSDMEKMQQSVMEEQLLWQQYSLNGMQQFQQSPYGRL